MAGEGCSSYIVDGDGGGLRVVVMWEELTGSAW